MTKNHFANLVKINESLNMGAAAHYKKTGLTYVDVPEIVGITGACENVDTLFKVGNRLDIPLFFTQTGQLSLEQSLQYFPGAYTVIHSGRDEEGEDERHLRQFRLTEEEFDSTMVGMTRSNYNEEKMFVALLTHIQKAIQAMIGQVLKDHRQILAKQYHRNLAKLQDAVSHDFLRINYEDAVKLLQLNGKPKLKFGDDLKAGDEALIVKLLNKPGRELPVFITRYPKEIKFFNMKVSQADPRVVLSADLILPYAGEATGSAVREHDFAKLKKRLLTSTMFKLHQERGGTITDFKWYLKIIEKKGTQPHAGYGIGNERVLQYILGFKDIRKASLFSLLDKQSGDWDKKRYGQAAIILGHKQQILLTIGKTEDKQALLPSIRPLSANENFTLYATQHTHEFMKKQGIQTARVYKISQIGETPNIADLLRKRTFDIVINIPTGSKGELTDGKLIRRASAEAGVTLITDLRVAQLILKNLAGVK